MPSPTALPHGVRFGAEGSQLCPPLSLGVLPARSHQRHFPKEGHPDFKEKTAHDESKGVDGAMIYNPALGRASESCQHPENAPLIPSKKLQCLLLELGSLGHRVLLLGQPAVGGSSDAERRFWRFSWGTAALLGAGDIPASPFPLLDAVCILNAQHTQIRHQSCTQSPAVCRAEPIHSTGSPSCWHMAIPTDCSIGLPKNPTGFPKAAPLNIHRAIHTQRAKHGGAQCWMAELGITNRAAKGMAARRNKEEII